MVHDVCDDFLVYLHKIKDQPQIDTKDVLQKMTINVMATTACGVKVNTLDNPNDIFYQMVWFHIKEQNI